MNTENIASVLSMISCKTGSFSILIQFIIIGEKTLKEMCDISHKNSEQLGRVMVMGVYFDCRDIIC